MMFLLCFFCVQFIDDIDYTVNTCRLSITRRTSSTTHRTDYIFYVLLTSYVADTIEIIILTADVAGRRHLRSSDTITLIVPSTRRPVWLLWHLCIPCRCIIDKKHFSDIFWRDSTHWYMPIALRRSLETNWLSIINVSFVYGYFV